MLETRGLTVAFGGLVAVNQVDVSVSQGEILGMIGPNGAGKTTFFNLVTGFLTPTSGQILFKGGDIIGLPPSRIAALGICRTFQITSVFPGLTVWENLRLGAYLTNDRQLIQQRMERVFGYFPILQERLHQLASTFSGGEQQMLDMGRGSMASPMLLMLDEPSLGLAPIMVQEVGKIVRTINQDGVTILLIEQNAQLALRLANRGYVLETGSIALEGSSAELISNDKVRKAYMGL